MEGIGTLQRRVLQLEETVYELLRCKSFEEFKSPAQKFSYDKFVLTKAGYIPTTFPPLPKETRTPKHCVCCSNKLDDQLQGVCIFCGKLQPSDPFEFFLKEFITKDGYLKCVRVAEYLESCAERFLAPEPPLSEEYLQKVRKEHLGVSLVRKQNGMEEIHPLVAKEYIKNVRPLPWVNKAVELWVEEHNKRERTKHLQELMKTFREQVFEYERILLEEDPSDREDFLIRLEKCRNSFVDAKKALMKIQNTP